MTEKREKKKLNDPHVNCVGLFKIFKTSDLEVVALRGLELTVNYREIVAIVGASGSGKSTLLNILAGYDFPSAGSVQVGSHNLLQMTEREAVIYRRYEVGFIWQQANQNLFPYLSAIENIQLPMMVSNMSRNERQNKSEHLLEMVGLTNRRNHKPIELSGGEQQRVSIAVGLSNSPSLLLADEPTGELDEESGHDVLDLMNTINREIGTTIIIVTHDPLIYSSVNRAITIKDGKTSTEIDQSVLFRRKEKKIPPRINEYLLIDSSGNVQIPKEILSDSELGRRVRIGKTSKGEITLESNE
ncbi:MAG: ABC transporter ATP-binding protein [SAR202 cluster bacterium]|jgi:ABC-type lipoprotein export system ATPase subunit|nr:ABC transporter [Chloroflexota bacterium]MDP6425869.1 ABC transporter ATP-binding protein [Dehalococcoidia bacterium]MDP7231839.1 ABC transporter ATP-binding protein [Dehalococcoidia bacterium]MDP7613586.1 ABC transporter ATP-binding protein [Dehalococcoidia bacterium]MQG47269.1 ABC transporter ATP-binding protein [SAR202 cluster bacterium]|tara:strand:- start:3605 stop:4504 length:900 start_codon:yes stop_codon:yes gene_type:complete